MTRMDGIGALRLETNYFRHKVFTLNYDKKKPKQPSRGIHKVLHRNRFQNKTRNAQTQITFEGKSCHPLVCSGLLVDLRFIVVF